MRGCGEGEGWLRLVEALECVGQDRRGGVVEGVRMVEEWLGMLKERERTVQEW